MCGQWAEAAVYPIIRHGLGAPTSSKVLLTSLSKKSISRKNRQKVSLIYDDDVLPRIKLLEFWTSCCPAQKAFLKPDSINILIV